MTQDEAIKLLEEKILEHESYEKATCTGDWITCPNEECMVCGVRECPNNEPLHYHHDGCPACWQEQEKIDNEGRG